MKNKEKSVEDEFSLEAKIYDKIWGQRNYDVEVEFLHELFQKHGCKSIVDVGCGTGNHILRLGRRGYEMTGVDLSPTMLGIAKKKCRSAGSRFVQGDMKKLENAVRRSKRFDAAFSLGHACSHLYTDTEVQLFLKGVHKVLKKNGLFVFNINNAKKINEDYLNRLLLDHVVNEERLQIIVLAHNTRDLQNPNIVCWKPIYLTKKNGKMDLQIREHRLRWFEFSTLKKLIAENSFEVVAVYSGPAKEEFNENLHKDAWFVTTAK
jgi:ubiquinone/menaquinone biosynthesis C-methylase UbiE